MGRSFRLASVAGVAINLHPTLLLLLPFGAMIWGGRHGAAGALFGILMIALLFVCIALHELGHALAARGVDIPVKEIQLLPIGGLAVLGRPVTRPLDELVIALAGPFVNLLIVVGLAVAGAGAGLFTQLTPEQIAVSIGTPSLQGGLLWLIQANVLLVLFNMIPAFPMDGGRVLRAGIALAAGMPRATEIAAAIGQGLAVLLGAWGLTSGNLLLALSAVYIFISARQEALAAQALGASLGLRAADAYAPHTTGLEIGQRVNDAATLIQAGGHHALPVLQGERLLGVLTRGDVVAARIAGRGEAWVTALMRRDIPRVAPEAALEQVQQLMAERQAPVVAVYDGERYLGLITAEGLRDALRAPHQGRQPAAGASGAD